MRLTSCLALALAFAIVPAACSSSSSPATQPAVDAGPTPDAATDAQDPMDAGNDATTDATDDADGGYACALGFLGDESKPVEMTLIVRGVDGTSMTIDDGATVPLVTPPQGGKVIFIGVRATNLTPCAVALTGALRDPISQQVRVDGRALNLTPQPDGWGASADSNISTFANIPTCPNQWASQDLYNQTFVLEVSIKDPDGRTAKKTIQVTPQCAEIGTGCECSCKQGYILGQACP